MDSPGELREVIAEAFDIPVEALAPDNPFFRSYEEAKTQARREEDEFVQRLEATQSDIAARLSSP